MKNTNRVTLVRRTGTIMPGVQRWLKEKKNRDAGSTMLAIRKEDCDAKSMTSSIKKEAL